MKRALSISMVWLLAGCSNQESGGLRRASEVRLSDVRSLLSPKPEIRVGSRVRRYPLQQVVDSKKMVRGYVQEEIYPVHGDDEVTSARMLMVLDDRWFRRGFVTEDGNGYAFDAQGEAISLGKAKFHEHLRGILGVSGEMAIGPYEPEEHQPPGDSKKTDAGIDAGSGERPGVPAEEGNTKASEQ